MCVPMLTCTCMCFVGVTHTHTDRQAVLCMCCPVGTDDVQVAHGVKLLATCS